MFLVHYIVYICGNEFGGVGAAVDMGGYTCGNAYVCQAI